MINKDDAMRKEDIINTLTAHRSQLREMGIKSLALFGSTARDEATEGSDVDLLVEFDRPVGLFHFARVRRELSNMLGCPVDLVTRKALREETRDEILQEAIHAA